MQNWLVEWNEKMNLTAIKDPKEIAVKHFVDSLTIFSRISLQKRKQRLLMWEVVSGNPMKLV